MLSYQHGYHAGNFADVIKHFTLTRILEYLKLKEKPFLYYETHAGRGLYDLTSKEAAKTAEAQLGIKALWEKQNELSALFLPYLKTIQHYNPLGKLRYYPGSPLFANHLSRDDDRIYCCELHPREYQALNALLDLNSDRKIFFNHSDGLTQLKALMPPPERRGLIFIDPSYEIKSDYKTIPDYVADAYKRFSSGIYCVWYPIVDKKWTQQLLNKLNQGVSGEKLNVEFYFNPEISTGMTGCGLWIANPPFVLYEELKKALPQLKNSLNDGKSSFVITGK